MRLQPERGQGVIASGPYRFVRHPGYLGGLLFLLPTGPALGSWWAALPALPILVLILRRTALEDAMLHASLSGYADYARKVRFRLLPGIW